MDLTFNIDFDAAEVYVIVDNHITVSVTQDGDEYTYKNFDRLDDDTVQAKLKTVCKILLTLEDE